MKIKSLFSRVLWAAAIAFVQTGCESVSQRPVRVRESPPYAIVAVDAQGTLSQTELNAIEDSLVQYLLDQHYVRTDQVLVADPSRAAIVFQFKIAWNQDRTSFAIASVTPESGGDALAEAPAPGYATPGPQPYGPPSYNGWENDPWNYDPWGWNDGYGYGSGWYPYGPSFGGPAFPGHGDHRDHDRNSRGEGDDQGQHDRDGHSDRDRDRQSHRDDDHARDPRDRPFSPHRPPSWNRDNGSSPNWQGGRGSSSFREPIGIPTRPEQNHGAPGQGFRDFPRPETPQGEHGRRGFPHDFPAPSNFRRGPVRLPPHESRAPSRPAPERQIVRPPRFSPPAGRGYSPPPHYSPPPPHYSRPAAPVERAPAPPPRNESRPARPEK